MTTKQRRQLRYAKPLIVAGRLPVPGDRFGRLGYAEVALDYYKPQGAGKFLVRAENDLVAFFGFVYVGRPDYLDDLGYYRLSAELCIFGKKLPSGILLGGGCFYLNHERGELVVGEKSEIYGGVLDTIIRDALSQSYLLLNGWDLYMKQHPYGPPKIDMLRYEITREEVGEWYWRGGFF